MSKRKIHKSITLDRLMAAVDSQTCGLENPGFCVNCGSEYSDCEPDCRRRKCEDCDELAVYGAEEILMRVS